MSRWNDAEFTKLISRIARKNGAGFDPFFEQTYQKIYYFGLLLTESAEEAAKTVRRTYLRTLGNIGAADRLGAAVWLTGMAYQEILQAQPSEERVQLGTQLKDDTLQTIMEQIQRLPLRQKAVLFLNHFIDLSSEETAQALQISSAEVQGAEHLAAIALAPAMPTVGKNRDWIKAALDAQAHVVVMPADDAFSVLVDSLGTAGLSTDSAEFNAEANAAFSRSASSGRQSSLMTTVLLIAAAVAVAFGIIYMILSWRPIISSVNYSTSLTNQNVLVTVTMRSNIGIANVYATNVDGVRYYADRLSDGSYQLEVGENGEYALTAEANNGKTAAESFTISSIDKDGPKIVTYELKDGVLTLIYQDSTSGIDYDSAYAQSTDGTVYHPSSVDQDTGTFTYDFPAAGFSSYLKDKLGNESVYTVARQ